MRSSLLILFKHLGLAYLPTTIGFLFSPDAEGIKTTVNLSLDFLPPLHFFAFPDKSSLFHQDFKDEFKPEINTILTLQREPENTKDPHAVAITEQSGRVVGHIPLGLSKIVSSFLKRINHRGEVVICGKRVNRRAGMGLEIPVLYELYGECKYLTRLDQLIMGSDKTKQSLRAKQEGISSTTEAT